MPRLLRLAPLALLLAVLAPATLVAPASAQSVDVTFRFLPDLTPPPISPVVRAFVPGSFNDWGPNSSGRISSTAPSRMDYDEGLEEYRYTTSLTPGGGPAEGGYPYKIHYHSDGSGSQYTWLTDPLGTEVTGPNNDSVVRVSDPMAFQLAREQNADGLVAAVSVGLFGSEAFTEVTFTVNGLQYGLSDGITDTGDGIYRLVLPTPVAPGSQFAVEATDVSGDVVSASVGTVPPVVTDAPVPDGIEDGITTLADGTTYFVLRAPEKSYVYVLGEFNGWTETEDGLMFRDDSDPRGTRWWVRVDGLTPGQAYGFTYFVDGTLEVTDPYAPLVYYPGESQHPGGGITYAVGQFVAGGSTFEWTDDDFVVPAPEDLVVYELLVRDFLADHSFTSLTDTLDYLERLGVNAIELMPVSEYDGDESWGYNPAFHLALDKYYGTPGEFKAFVNEAHSRGIAVLLDVVYNHATGQSPLIRLYNGGGFSGPSASSPYANVEATHPYNVFNDLNHESELTQIWLDKANRFWMDEYHVDGYRFDLTGGFMQTGSFFGYNASRVALLERMMDALWEEHPDAIVILEHLVESGQEWGELATHGQDEGRPGALLWHHMNREYSQSAMGYPTATDFPSTLVDTYPPNWVGGVVPTPNAMTYMESHDEQWMMYRNRAYGNQNGAYDIRQLHIGLDRQKLAGAFFFTVPGPRMVWQFGELGYGFNPGECLVNGDYPGECAAGVPDRVANKPIRWDYWEAGVSPVRGAYTGTLTAASDRERELRQKLYKTWSALMNLRQDYEIFRDPETDVTTRLGRVPDRYIQLELADAPDGQPTEAVVFGNFGVAETTVTLTFDETQTWYDFFDDTETTLAAGSHSFTLLPGEFRVWTDVDVPSPEPGLITVDAEEAPASFAPGALRAFPNPAAARLAVEIDVAAPGDLRVDVLDVLGRRVAPLHDGPAATGRQRVEADVQRLPAGVYLIRATIGDRSETLRVTVAR